jgi:hypothetical protein
MTHGIETHAVTETYYKKANDVERTAFRKWIKDMMHFGPIRVHFQKKDGSIRIMNCTLEESVVVPHEKTTDRVKEQNDEVCPVWDIDKGAWRSFRYDSVTKIEIDIATD